jgi:anthranilate phosphoribosyltransferase
MELQRAFHKPYVSKYLECLKMILKEVLVVKAAEGSPEVFKMVKYWKEVDGEITEVSFSIKDFGLHMIKVMKISL